VEKIHVSMHPRLQTAIGCVRPAVRALKPYLVGGTEEVTIKLNQNESPYDVPEDLKQELARKLLEIPLNRYPDEQPWTLIDALAKRHQVRPNQILVGNGSNDLTYTLGLAFISPGTPVVMPRPMFSLWQKVVALYDGEPVEIGPNADFSFDVPSILRAMADHAPPLTILTSPNNPTGTSFTFSDLEALVDAAPGVIVVDEAYGEFLDQPSAFSLLERYPNLLVMRTFSKALGLAGVRLGYLVGHPDLISELFKSRLPFLIDRLAEATALAVLAHPELEQDRVALLKKETAALLEGLTAIPGVEAVPPTANFILFRTPFTASEVVSGLKAQGILIRSMAGYPELQGYVRVNAGTPEENRRFLSALQHLVVQDAQEV